VHCHKPSSNIEYKLLKAFSGRMKMYGPNSLKCLTCFSLVQCKRKCFPVSLGFSSFVGEDYSLMGYDAVLIGRY
jgi:hypothetical protein